MNNHTAKQRSSRDFAFTFQKLFESGIRLVKKVLITVVSEANCCFILIGDFFDETEIYDTNNKRSLHLSENYKQRCLKLQRFSHTVLSFLSNETMLSFN